MRRSADTPLRGPGLLNWLEGLSVLPLSFPEFHPSAFILHPLVCVAIVKNAIKADAYFAYGEHPMASAGFQN
jgi:hypothetical protein